MKMPKQYLRNLRSARMDCTFLFLIHTRFLLILDTPPRRGLQLFLQKIGWGYCHLLKC